MAPLESVPETIELEGGSMDSMDSSVFSDLYAPSRSGGGGGGGRSRRSATIRSRRRSRSRHRRSSAYHDGFNAPSPSGSSFATLVAVSAAIFLLANVAFPSTPAGVAMRRAADAGLGAVVRAAASAASSSESVGGTRGYGRSLGAATTDGNDDGSGSGATTNRRTREQRTRPAMHTFFHRIDPSSKGTGMSDRADQELLEAWRNAWYDAGYDPVVLTLDDAKRHPDYRRYAQKLQGVPMMGRGGKGLNIFYNQLCYYRWLAMAVVGGGWEVDYDVFPLHPHQPSDDGAPVSGGADPSDPDGMPNGGDFTVYQFAGKSPEGKMKGVPSMMSGRESEWTRLAFNILENGLRHTDEVMWTDFFALMDVAGTYAVRDEVVQGHKVLTGKPITMEDCDAILGKRAVHFSHDAMVKGVLPGGGMLRVEDRPRIVSDYLQNWRRECGGVVASRGSNGGAQGQQQQPPLEKMAPVERQRQAEAAAAAAAQKEEQESQQRRRQATAPQQSPPQDQRQTQRASRQGKPQVQAQTQGQAQAQQKPPQNTAVQQGKQQEQQPKTPAQAQAQAPKPPAHTPAQAQAHDSPSSKAAAPAKALQGQVDGAVQPKQQ